MMPPSRKGAKREEERAAKPVPIPPALAAKLRMAAAGRAATAALLVRADGKRWSDNHLRIFATAAKRAGLEYVGDERVTIYALRHSSIVRAILAGQPMRVVAATHDTSTAMLERTYSAKISDVADKIAREGLLDFDQTPSTDDNVVPLPRRS
jgi:hypothetical protein